MSSLLKPSLPFKAPLRHHLLCDSLPYPPSPSTPRSLPIFTLGSPSCPRAHVPLPPPRVLPKIQTFSSLLLAGPRTIPIPRRCPVNSLHRELKHNLSSRPVWAPGWPQAPFIQVTSYCSPKIGFGPRMSQMTSYHSSKIRLSSLITPYLATLCRFQLHNYFKPWDLKRKKRVGLHR